MTSRIDLNALVLFYDVVNARSINRAAGKLKIAKSTISRKLRRLEAQLGAVLIKRGTRRLALTEVGQSLFKHCARITTEIDEASMHAADMQLEMSGPLRVSMPVVMTDWISGAIALYMRENPRVRLEIETHNHWIDISEEPFDIAIHLGRPVSSDVPMRGLGELSRHFYASPAYLAERGVPHSIDDLARHDCVQHQYQQRDGIWPQTVSVEGKQEPLRSRITVNHAVLARELVLSGVGLAILPDIMCADDVSRGDLVELDVGYHCPPLLTSATLYGRGRAPAKTRAFLELVVEHLRSRRP